MLWIIPYHIHFYFHWFKGKKKVTLAKEYGFQHELLDMLCKRYLNRNFFKTILYFFPFDFILMISNHWMILEQYFPLVFEKVVKTRTLNVMELKCSSKISIFHSVLYIKFRSKSAWLFNFIVVRRVLYKKIGEI